jgi:HEAT repeat protein
MNKNFLSKAIRFTLPAVALLFASALAVKAQTSGAPQISNAQMETRAVSGTLENTMRGITSSQTTAAWVGYSVPMINPGDGRRVMMCCGNWNSDYGVQNCGPCVLESSRGVNMNETDRPLTNSGPVKLEGPTTMYVLLRIADHKIGRIATYTEDCQIDAGGLHFTWLTGVNPAESVALLTTIVADTNYSAREGRDSGDSAIRAIAMHGDPSADRALNSFVALDKPEGLRSKTAFWLGNSRGRSGFEVLKRMAKSDTSPAVRDQVTFALSQSHEKDALDELVRMAKEDESVRVRGQALFWLAQKAGDRAVGAISNAIDNDPDTEVKKKAVFALSQLPKDEGVPLMINVARDNKNPAVRKQAMFWLGQSKDPRAIAFFEQILTH